MIRPRQLAHRGTVIARGFVVDADLCGEDEARRRVLALWTAGASVRSHDGRLIVDGIPAARVRVAHALGAPLVEQHGLLSTCPLEADEATALDARGALVLARGGVAKIVRVEDAATVDVASWIDLSAFAVADVQSLSSPPAAIAVSPPAPVDVRTITGAPPADAGVADVVAALVRARAERAKSGGAHGEPSAWSRFLHWLSTRIRPRPKQQKALPSGNATPPPPSLLDRMRSRLAETLWNSRLGAALGRKHAEYLRRVLDMFDRGDLQEALRHAVPLGGGDGIGQPRLALTVPQRRSSLSLSFGRRAAGSTIPVTDLAESMMRERYRAAAEKLEQAGKLDEAAFVLAELLADVKAALALLERHGRYELAARLAEARVSEPGLVVRLYFLAGNRERAIDLARRHQAWADAVARLERSGDSRGAVLRLLWADHLADTGDFVGAVEAAWRIESARSLVEAWIDRGIAAEGSAAARLLVKKLVVAPAHFPSVAPPLLSILSATDGEATRNRSALVEELVAASPTPELQTIARPALRALIRDCGAGAENANVLLDRLTTFVDDAALKADQPAIVALRGTPRLRDRPDALALEWSAHDAGAIPVYDAAYLPNGRIVVALGELGVRILGRTGTTIAEIDQPATRLVISDHGTRALAIAARGQVHRIARLDLVERRGKHWCDAEFDTTTRTFDGDLWFVARGREIFAVDTTSPRWRAVWGVTVDPTHMVTALRREDTWLGVSVRTDDELEHWHYERLTLRERKPWPAAGNERAIPRPRANPLVIPDPFGVEAELAGELAVVSRRTEDGRTLAIEDLHARRTLARLALEGAPRASIRLAANQLTIGDARGRVIVFDVDVGVVRREHRIS